MGRDHPGQTDLVFEAAEPVHPDAVASVKDVERVVAVLDAHGRLTAGEICGRLGRPATENNKRRIRAAARAAFPGILSFSLKQDDGTLFAGYKLLAQATLAEAYAALRQLENIERDTVAKKKLLLDAIHSGKVGGV